MSNEIIEQISIRIGEKLGHSSPTSSECSIFKVRHHLCMVNKKAYEPEMLAIGPYHRGKENLKSMEDHKISYLQKLLQRREENNVTRYVMAMKVLEERARKCYAESISPDNNIGEFAEMMLLDGCFILELIRKKAKKELRDETDPIFNVPWMIGSLECDMMLVENQVPFFILEELFRMTAMPNEEYKDLMQMIFHFFKIGRDNVQFPNKEIKHLLGLFYDYCIPPTLKTEARDEENNLKFIPSAMELREAGIKFKAVQKYSVYDINFKNGIMEMPVLNIEDRTESVLRNLIAYEQLCSYSRYVVDYATFMDCLIDSPKDVELLRREGIIENRLGDDEVVANMFNRLCDYVSLSDSNFHYSKVFNNVNRHCSRRRNKWMANLRHNYFNTPWAFISFIAAAFLLLLTLIQTVFSVLAYF